MTLLEDRILSRPRLLSLVLGALAATGFQPLHFWPVGCVALAGLVWLVWRSATVRKAAFLGWLFGVAHFTVTNNWIATAFTFQSEMPTALGWAAVPLLSLYLAVFPAIACALAKALAPRAHMPAFSLVLGASWIVGEWLRSWVFTGYAWGPLSMMLVGPFDRPGAALLLPFFGTYALSGVLLAVCGLTLALAVQRRWALAGVAPALLTFAMLWPAPEERAGTIPFTLVQPLLKQTEIDDPSKYEEQFVRIAGLSLPREPLPNRLILWPESGVPDYLEPGYPQIYYDQSTAGGDPDFARKRIARIGGEGSLVATGTVNLALGTRNGVRTAVGAGNSIMAIGPGGRIAGRYDKAHLVPYGEYLPMRDILAPLGLSRLVAGTLDFIPGPGPRTLDLGPWGRMGAQICYEIVFSGEVVDRGGRPDYIFNPSNDGWFGAWGPPQHLAQARMRGLEEGLPVLRATTTGISAVVSADGVVRQHIGRGVAGRLDGIVPAARAPTPFARLGHWLTLAWAMVLLGIYRVASRHRVP